MNMGQQHAGKPHHGPSELDVWGDEKPLVTAPIVAKMLGTTSGAIYRMVKANKLPAFTIGPRGRSLRFNLEEVFQATRRQAQ